MKRSRFLQGFTLLSFLFLLTAFVLYRLGKFDNYLSSERSRFQTSPNGGNVVQELTDTIPRVISDSSARLLLSSSKSIVVAEKLIRRIEKRPNYIDSIRIKRMMDSVYKKKIVLMSSSKSGYIFDASSIKPDSNIVRQFLRPDTVKRH